VFVDLFVSFFVLVDWAASRLPVCIVNRSFNCFIASLVDLSFAYLVAWLLSYSSELFNNTISTATWARAGAVG
jgi:hypothetical protein